MKRILCSLLVATLPFGSALGAGPTSKNAKVTLVYQHELLNVPGKSIKGVLVEYGARAATRLATRMPNPPSSLARAALAALENGDGIHRTNGGHRFSML